MNAQEMMVTVNKAISELNTDSVSKMSDGNLMNLGVLIGINGAMNLLCQQNDFLIQRLLAKGIIEMPTENEKAPKNVNSEEPNNVEILKSEIIN